MTTFRGFPACTCLVAWLPVYEQELKRRGVIRDRIDIAQLIGGAPASGGTHSQGGAFDIWQHDETSQLVAREMGAATWNRIPPWWTGSQHTHGVLNGCPHNGPARYQITALANGGNGLGSGGMGGSDYGPGPRHLRDWRDGIKWAHDQGDDMFEKSDSDRLARVEDALKELVKDERRRNMADIQRVRRVIKAVAGVDADVERIKRALAEEDK